LFKLKPGSIVKKIKKANFYKKISLFGFSDNYFSLDYHRLRSYYNSIRESKSNKQIWGRW